MVGGEEEERGGVRRIGDGLRNGGGAGVGVGECCGVGRKGGQRGGKIEGKRLRKG